MSANVEAAALADARAWADALRGDADGYDHGRFGVTQAVVIRNYRMSAAMLDALCARVAALEAEREGLRADAARLDWLQRHGVSVLWLDPESGDASACLLVYMTSDTNEETGGDTLTECIDAARDAGRARGET